MIGLARMIIGQAQMKCGYGGPHDWKNYMMFHIESRDEANDTVDGHPIFATSQKYYQILDQINDGTWIP